MTNLLRFGPAGAPDAGPASVAADESGSMEGRIWFAQMLRGVAALLVVYFHLADHYWKDNNYVSSHSNLPSLGVDKTHPWHLVLTGFFGHNHLELGDFGVALFFLISGFVIPFSLAKVGGLKFLVRRAFRIYPTYMVCFSLTALVLLLNSRVFGLPLGFSLAGFWASVALLQDVFRVQPIDPVSWTLVIEMRFYLLCALLTAFRPLTDWRLIAGLALVFVAADLAGTHATGEWAATLSHIPYLTFMFLGTCFYNLIQGTWRPVTFGCMFALLALCFLAETSAISAHNWRLRMLHAYPAAAVVFSLAYHFRSKFKPHAALDFFAQVSYPLYAVHSLLGFSLMYFFYHLHPLPFVNFLEAFAVVLPVAWVIHHFIEVPSNRFGHVLTRDWAGRALPRPAVLRA